MTRASAAAFLVTMTASLAAYGDPTKDECVDADTRAQVARSAGKFRDAREQLELCIAQSCPPLVRSDCTERLDEVSKNAPSVVFDVKNADGADIAATQVTLDGKPLLDRLDGKAVSVDTGEHTFIFTPKGHLATTQRILIHDGDKDRRIAVVVGTPTQDTSTKTVIAQKPIATPDDVTSSTPDGKAQRAAGITIGTVGLVSLAVSGVLAALSTAAWQRSQAKCNGSTCTQYDAAVGEHNTAYDFAVAATVVVVAGGILAGTGVLLFVTAPRASKETQQSHVRLVPVIGPMSGFLLRGVF